MSIKKRSDTLDSNHSKLKKTFLKEVGEDTTKLLIFFDFISCLLVVIDKDQNVLYANEALAKTLGLKKEEVVGKNWFDNYIPVEVRSKVKNVFNQIIEANLEPVRDYENPIQNKKGEKITILWRNTFLRDKDMQIVGTISAGQDITKIKLVEKAYEQTEKEYKELFNNMKNGVAIYKAIEDGNDFVFIDINKAGEKISKVRKEDVLYKSIKEKFPGVVEMGLFDALKTVWRTGKPKDFPTRLYKDERITRWIDHSLYKLPGGDVVAVFDDVTVQKKAKDELQNKVKELEKLTEAMVGRELKMVELKDKAHKKK